MNSVIDLGRDRRSGGADAGRVPRVRRSVLTSLAGKRTAIGARLGRASAAHHPSDGPSPAPFAPGEWGLSRDPAGTLSLAGIGLAELVAEHGSPLHVVDGRALDRNAGAALEPFRRGEGADVYSSYKTNPIPAVLARLHAAGVGAEAISAYEFWLAVRLGVPPERIVYNGPAKSPESLEEAARLGIHLVNANSRTDLAAMADAARRAGRPMRSGVRISLPHMWGGQFGVRGSSDQVAASVVDGVGSPDLDLIGLHFHSGLPLATGAELTTHLEAVLAACDRIASTTGWHPSVLDLGGSLVCPTVKRAAGVAEPLTIGVASELMWSAVRDHMHGAGRPVPEVFIEPGRSLTGDTQFLLATVLAVRDRGAERPSLVLDIGVELAEPMRGEPHQVFVLNGADRGERRYRLCGPRADIADVLVDEIALPEVDVGDLVAVMDAGAYFVPFSTAASFAKPAIVLVDDRGPRSIRRREDAPDLWRHDQAPRQTSASADD